MADLENGLPPKGTDITNKKVSDISIQTDQTEAPLQQGVQAIFLNTEQTNNPTESSIKSITFSTEPTGKNLVLFYL